MDSELTQEQKESMLPILDALEENYIKVRKPLIDKLQEIENQLVTFQGNELVTSGLSIIQRETMCSLAKLEGAYKQCVSGTEHYIFRLYAITKGQYYY